MNTKKTKNKQKNRIATPKLRYNRPRPIQYQQDYPNDIMAVGDIYTPHNICKMSFTSEVKTYSVGATFFDKAYVANGLFDPDPALGGTTYAGFTAKASDYREYLVEYLEFEWDVSNLESFPVFVGVYFSNLGTGLITTEQQLRDALENGFSTRPRTLGAKGGLDTTKLRGKLNLSKLLGNDVQYIGSGRYSSLNNSNPAAQLFIHFGVISQSGTNLTNGVTGSPTLHATCRWYNRQTNFD